MVDLKTNPHQLSIDSSQIQDIYMSLEQEIFKMIANRLNTKGLMPDNVMMWQMQKLNELHLLNEATLKLLAEATGLAEKSIQELFINQGLKVYDESMGIISESNPNAVVNNDIEQMLNGYANQTFMDMKNTVNQTLVSTNYGDKSLVTDMYQQIIKETTGSVIAGFKTPERALADTIYKWRDRGIKPVLVDKGGNEWSLEGYVRTVVNTTSGRAFQTVRDTAAHDNGIDTFVMSSHSASRKACAPIQGKLVTDRTKSFTDKVTGEHFESLYNHGYGKPEGTFGINCKHIKWPYIPGVNTNNQPQYDQHEAVANGKIQQKQRALERRVREEKRKLELAQELGDDAGTLKYKLATRKYQSALRKLVADNDFLGRDYAREKPYGRMPKTTRRYEEDFDKDVSAFNEFKKIVGNNRPGIMLDSYRMAKYTDGKQWQEIKSSYKWSKANFTKEKLLNSHFNKHSEEFGNITKDDYLKMAQTLLSQPVSKNILGYDTKTGRRVRYDKINGTFAVGGDSKIRTFFKPDDREGYFYDNYKKDYPD